MWPYFRRCDDRANSRGDRQGVLRTSFHSGQTPLENRCIAFVLLHDEETRPGAEPLRWPPWPPSPTQALAHFSARFAFETDCWDVHSTEVLDDRGFVLVDVRSQDIYENGHLEGAVNIPHWTITQEVLVQYPADTLFVVYCSGLHCNVSTRGAMRFAELGRPVKEMIGGTAGWVDEGFSLKTP